MATGKILYKSMYWKIFQLCTSLVINIVLSRLFQSAISAIFFYLVYLLSLCTGVFTLGLDIGLNYYLTRGEISAGWVCRVILVVTALALVISLPLIGVYYGAIPVAGLDREKLLLFSGFHISGVLLATLSGTIFTAYGRNHELAAVAFFINLLIAAGCLLVSVVLPRERAVVDAFCLYFFFSFLQGIILFIMAWRRYGLATVKAGSEGGSRQSQPPIGAILRFSFGAFLTNFIFFFGARACIYLLPYRALPGPAGNYIQAYKIVEYFSLVAAFLYYPFITIVAGGDRGKLREKVLFLVRLSNTFVLIGVVVLLATGRWLFPFIFGSSFEAMYGNFLWLTPGLFAACSSTFFTAWYFGLGLIRVNFISACIQLVSVVLLFFLFMGQGDTRGAAMAFSLSSLLSAAYDVLIFRREGAFRLRALLLAGRGDWQVIRLFVRRLTGRQ